MAVAAPRIPAGALVAGAAVLLGLAVGWSVTQYPLLLVAAAIAAITAGLVALRSMWLLLFGCLAIAALGPYLTLPVGAAVTPSLLQIALLATLCILAAVVLYDRRQRLPFDGLTIAIVLLLGVIVAAFLLGAGYGYTTQTLHDFSKFLVAFGTFWIVVQLVRTLADLRLLLQLLLVLTSASALIGLTLYAAGPNVSLQFLARLIRFGYPSGRIVRYIEDDPGRAMRAVGTSVDPNSFGGLLMIGSVLAVGQLLVRHQSVTRWLTLPAAGLCATCLLLTYSRGAWVAAAAGIGLVLVLRRPAWVVPVGVLGAVAVAAGVGASFVNRLWLGFTLQDPATKLRLREYDNAIEIIKRHPWFGVGFGQAPTLDLQTGVSSIYLVIAERIGLVGLTVFLIVVLTIAFRGLMSAFLRGAGEESDLALTFTAAFGACLVVGLVDHYFFNPEFPHMTALFWCLAAATVVSAKLASGRHRAEAGSELKGAQSWPSALKGSSPR